LLFDAGEDWRMSFDQGAAALNAVGGGHAIGKFQECLSKNALTAIDIHDSLIVSEVGRCRGEALAASLKHAAMNNIDNNVAPIASRRRI
jgi:hypothetical protein